MKFTKMQGCGNDYVICQRLYGKTFSTGETGDREKAQ